MQRSWQECCRCFKNLVVWGAHPRYRFLEPGAGSCRCIFWSHQHQQSGGLCLRNMDRFPTTPPSWPDPPLDLERPAMYLVLFVAIVALGGEAHHQHRRRLRAEADLAQAQARLTETDLQLADQTDESDLLRESLVDVVQTRHLVADDMTTDDLCDLASRMVLSNEGYLATECRARQALNSGRRHPRERRRRARELRSIVNDATGV